MSTWRRAIGLLWAGQSVSLIGDQITLLALPVTALALGATPAQVAALAATAEAPFIVLGLPAGAWVARIGLRRSMLLADLVRGAALGSLLIGPLGFGRLFLVALVLGCATVFFQVAYQSFTPVLVEDPDQLRSANTRLQASESLAQIGGPAVGGVLIGALGALRSLGVDAASYAVSVGTLVALRGAQSVPSKESVLAQMRAGIGYVRRQRALRALLWASIIFNLGSAGFHAMLVLFAVRTLGLSTTTLGLAVGLGGLGVPVGLALSRVLDNRRTLILSGALSAFGYLIAASAPWGGPAVAVLIGAGTFVTGVGGGAWGVTALTTRQRLSPAEHRAMTTAVFRWATYSVVPVGALLAGAAAATLGVRAAVLIFAAIAQLCVLPLLGGSLHEHDDTGRPDRQHPPAAGRTPDRPLSGDQSRQTPDRGRPDRRRPDRGRRTLVHPTTADDEALDDLWADLRGPGRPAR